MPLINLLSERLRKHPKRIVFPEGADPRILQAARRLVLNRMGVPILLGDRSLIKAHAQALDINLEGIRLIEPRRSSDFPGFVQSLANLPRFSDLSRGELEETAAHSVYFGALMLMHGHASGMVAGATLSATSSLRPMLQVLPFQEGVTTISSLQMLDFEEPNASTQQVLFLADCAVLPNPNAEQIADIAINTGRIAYHLTDTTPAVAMLSYTTHAENCEDPSVLKMQKATTIARNLSSRLSFQMEVDGELQADAALEAHTAAAKGLSGPVAGRANVLVFPDLHSANIGSKLVQALTGARTYGSILTGFQFPVAEISRGASAHDILGTAIILGAQAIDHKLLHLHTETEA